MTKYRVSGPTAYLDHQPGEEFDADLDEEQEDRALERGSIEIVGARKTKGVKDDA
jgi:hypothetical protein